MELCAPKFYLSLYLIARALGDPCWLVVRRSPWAAPSAIGYAFAGHPRFFAEPSYQR